MQDVLKVTTACLLLLVGCVPSTRLPESTDCPLGLIEIESDHGGRSTCVTREEYEEEMRRVLGERW